MVLNDGTEGPIDYSGWVPESPSAEQQEMPNQQGRRWCPSHHRYEPCQPGKRLPCGLAWADQYRLEDEVKADSLNPNQVIIQLADSIKDLIDGIRHTGIVDEPPPKHNYPPPPQQPPPTRRSGKGGVSLP